MRFAMAANVLVFRILITCEYDLIPIDWIFANEGRKKYECMRQGYSSDTFIAETPKDCAIRECHATLKVNKIRQCSDKFGNE